MWFNPIEYQVQCRCAFNETQWVDHGQALGTWEEAVGLASSLVAMGKTVRILDGQDQVVWESQQ